MSFWSLIEGGISSPSNKTCGQRLSAWFGRHTACRSKNVFIHKSSLISPDARINPRKGKISIGESCVIAPNAVLQGNIRMGNNCSVQYNSLLIGYGGPNDTEGFITIGNNVRIAPNVMIISANHIFSNPDVPIRLQGMDIAPITIEDDVWVAGGVHITAGATIGKGSVIGAGSVVTRNIPPYSVAVGVPAKVIKQRTAESKG